MATWTWTGNVAIGPNGQSISTGSGDPDGVITAPVGSLYFRIDGGVNTSLYVKEAGSGNVGWIGLGSGGGGSTTLATLTDVNLSSPTNGQILQYESGFWVNATINVNAAGANGQLQFNESNNFTATDKLAWDNSGFVLSVDGNIALTGATTQKITAYNLLSPSMPATGLSLDVPSHSPDGFYLVDDSGDINIAGSHSNGGLTIEATNTGDVLQIETDAGVFLTNDTFLYAPVRVDTQSVSYQPVAADGDQLVVMNSSSATNFTIPAHSGSGIGETFPVGTTLSVLQQGTGQVTLVAAGGVTINTPSSFTTRAQWSTISVVQIATNTWVAGGDLT